ncbi:hypothetical protein ES708_28683 [subsurface metagenome]
MVHKPVAGLEVAAGGATRVANVLSAPYAVPFEFVAKALK